MVGRDEQRTIKAVAGLDIAHPNGTVTAHIAELADLSAVRELADDLVDFGEPLDAVVHNSGSTAASARPCTSPAPPRPTRNASVSGLGSRTEPGAESDRAGPSTNLTTFFLRPPTGRIWHALSHRRHDPADVRPPRHRDRHCPDCRGCGSIAGSSTRSSSAVPAGSPSGMTAPVTSVSPEAEEEVEEQVVLRDDHGVRRRGLSARRNRRLPRRSRWPGDDVQVVSDPASAVNDQDRPCSR